MENLILRDTNRADASRWGKYGYGGNKRTMQLAELVQLANYAIADIKRQVQTTRWSRYSQGWQFLNRYKFEIKPKLKMVGVCGYIYQRYKQSFQSHSGQKIFLQEEPNNFISYYAAQEEGFKTLAVPHNLETFVVGYKDFFTGKGLPYCLELEIKHLAMADAVFCISREEQWLLKMRGIDADFLPYYPPQSARSQLLEVRNSRIEASSQRDRFLIVGVANNPSTALGLIEQAQWLKSIAKQSDLIVDVAGYDTEKLAEHFEHPIFKFHGTVEPQTLRKLMIEAKAVLLHQNTGVGALTRIPDMLVAGVPVIANSHACRSAHGYAGVYCYENELELADLLNKPLEIPPLLAPPAAAEKRFINCLHQPKPANLS